MTLTESHAFCSHKAKPVPVLRFVLTTTSIGAPAQAHAGRLHTKRLVWSLPFGDPDICLEAYWSARADGTKVGALEDTYDWVQPVEYASTAPTLPPKTILIQNGITIEHYYFGTDHGPAHAHVIDTRGYVVRIGPMGYPLKGDPELTSDMRRAIEENQGTIRHAINRIGRWLDAQDED